MTSDASDGSGSPQSLTELSRKRSSSHPAETEAPAKVTKRRAARACVSCRARKVRCDVVEGAPCGNCRWDNVECIVQESRRRKKHLPTPSLAANASHSAVNGAPGSRSSAEAHSHPHAHQHQPLRSKTPQTIHSADELRGHPTERASFSTNASASRSGSVRDTNTLATLPDVGSNAATPEVAGPGGLDQMIYQRSTTNGASAYPQDSVLQRPGASQQQQQSQPQQPQLSRDPQQPSWSTALDQASIFADGRTLQFLNSLDEADASAQLPGFVRPLPRKIDADDVKYLSAKGALDFPNITLQRALLQAYAEYVYPYMPLLDLHEFLSVVNRRDGLNGQTSLLLYQSIMFSATAFADMKYLREAGYPTRKAARKAFFQKTRLLYDLDYESDRLVLVQSLMHMTYWYETPDDQKDTWHWMGVAISLAHTIGLHRNPETTSMAASKQKLWKRVWWSCFMRDRLIALGMRRPTRIKDEDFDVPMLQESDFEIQVLPDNNSTLPPECTLIRNLDMQRDLAKMCIAKARLCVHISQMLKAQYSVLIRDNMKPENTTNSTMMLFPNKTLDNVGSVKAVDDELADWATSLPECCQYRTLTPLDLKNGRAVMAVQRTLLHMVYYTTVSALHRPQFLPSSPHQTPTPSRRMQEISRTKVRAAAAQITGMATELHQLRLERYLPTTGVTVVLPAMIIHLLEMKSPDPQVRDKAIQGFKQCKRVMEKMREAYSAADYATGFLDAALRKAAIDINANDAPPIVAMKNMPVEYSAQTPPPENAPYMTATETLFNNEKRLFKRTFATFPAGPNTASPADLELPIHSPPQTDLDDSNNAGLTPQTSGTASDEQCLDALDTLDLDFMQGHDEFDWNAVAGTDFDVDQYLQFPQDAVVGEMGTPAENGNDAEEKEVEKMDWVKDDNAVPVMA